MKKIKKTTAPHKNDQAKSIKIIYDALKDIALDLKELKIDQNLNKVNISLRINEVYERLNSTKAELSKQIRELNDKVASNVMGKLDTIVGFMKKLDEEREILAYRQANHSGRIENLETSVFGKPTE